MKASGIYFYITDNSIRPSGSSKFTPCVVGISKKGSLTELNDVTAKNLEEVLGYDLNYSPEMLGLSHLLELVSHVKFMRINTGALVGNAYLLVSDTSASSAHTVTNLKEADSLFTLSDLRFGVAHRDPGSWGNFAFRLRRRAVPVSVFIEDSTPYVLNVGQSIDKNLSFEVIHDSADPEIAANDKQRYLGASFQDADGNVLAVLVSDTATVGASFDIYTVDADGNYIANIGTYTLSTSPTTSGDTITLTGSTGYASMILSLHEAARTEYTLDYAEIIDSSTYSVKNSYDFSTSSASGLYYTKVSFGDLLIGGDMNLSSLPQACFDSWISLLSGDNGSAPTSSADLHLGMLDQSGVNYLALNGVNTLSVVNAIAKKCHSRLITCFVDAPAFTTYAQTSKWRSSVFASQYVAIGWVPDTEIVEGNLIYLWPSMNYLQIYANMFTAYGHCCFPPAGHSYGAIAANALLQTDAADHADELKTNRINYQIVDNRGACMWEDRTTYGLESDLSYIYTHIILRDLREQIITFMQNFNFRFTTGTDLLTIDSGLKDIFTKFKNQNFLSQFEVIVPSFEEAQAMGREIDIPMSCAVTQDGEVYNMRLTLNNFTAA